YCFCYLVRPHLHLHSFPTRRSSDLVPEYMVKGAVTYRLVIDQLGSVRLVVDATGNVAERIEYDEFGNVLTDSAPGFQPFGFAGGDRKSTRLNSSHQIISYAVFCLKK